MKNTDSFPEKLEQKVSLSLDQLGIPWGARLLRADMKETHIDLVFLIGYHGPEEEPTQDLGAKMQTGHYRNPERELMFTSESAPPLPTITMTAADFVGLHAPPPPPDAVVVEPREDITRPTDITRRDGLGNLLTPKVSDFLKEEATSDGKKETPETGTVGGADRGVPVSEVDTSTRADGKEADSGDHPSHGRGDTDAAARARRLATIGDDADPDFEIQGDDAGDMKDKGKKPKKDKK